MHSHHDFDANRNLSLLAFVGVVNCQTIVANYSYKLHITNKIS